MADVAERTDQTAELSPTAVRWTRDDCAVMERAGILPFRYELVEGMINRMSGGNSVQHVQYSALSPYAVRWTRADCDKLERAGLLNFRYELVDGVINKLGQNLGHAGIVQRLLAWLFAAFGSEFVLTQLTVNVLPEDNPTSQPEPDVILLSCRDSELRGNPRPEHLRLLIEASDTTVAYDLTTKARLYARVGIPEYWVVSLPDRKVIIHRNPLDGTYRDVTLFSENEYVAPADALDKSIAVSDLLPPAMRVNDN